MVSAARLRVLVCNNPHDEIVEEAYQQLQAKHKDVVFENLRLPNKDREECKKLFRELNHDPEVQRAVLSKRFGRA